MDEWLSSVTFCPGRRRFPARRGADDGYTRSPVLTEPEVTLSPDEIVLNLDANNRQQAIERAATLLAAARNLDAALVFRALWRREQAGSTVAGKRHCDSSRANRGHRQSRGTVRAHRQTDRVSSLGPSARPHPLCDAGSVGRINGRASAAAGDGRAGVFGPSFAKQPCHACRGVLHKTSIPRRRQPHPRTIAAWP